jgi:ribosome-associated protein
LCKSFLIVIIVTDKNWHIVFIRIKDDFKVFREKNRNDHGILNKGPKMEKIAIETEYIKLDQLLKFTGLAPSGGEAKGMIEAGLVTLNGEVCRVRRKKIYPGDEVRVGDSEAFAVTSQE